MPRMPAHLLIAVGDDLRFTARMELDRAPKTCAAFAETLPFRAQLIQARWSGEAAWIPLGDFDFRLGEENVCSRPGPGEILLYPAALSETEILFPYGETRFASKFGELAGNHFLTVVDGLEQLAELGRRVLWAGAQPINFSVQ